MTRLAVETKMPLVPDLSRVRPGEAGEAGISAATPRWQMVPNGVAAPARRLGNEERRTQKIAIDPDELQTINRLVRRDFGTLPESESTVWPGSCFTPPALIGHRASCSEDGRSVTAHVFRRDFSSP